MKTEILIVGAGPTGLALAARFARIGVPHVIADRLGEGQCTSRAAVLHAHTLEALEPLGATPRLAAEGLKIAQFSIRDRDATLARMRFDELPSDHPYLLMLPQDRTEAILAGLLEQAGGKVRRCVAIESLAQHADGVRAVASTPEGRETIEARYVIGADGMKSLVRETAGIGFSGSSYEESFVLADVDMTWSQGRDEVNLFFSPAGLVVVAPLPGGRFRIVATLEDAPQEPRVEHVQALLDARGPTIGAARVARVHWSSRFRLHHRVADRYRNGRLLLVGDAAHVHSPAGGQGMNTGLVDACVLGSILAEVVSGRREASYLDHYEALRRPAALQVLELAGRLTSMATMKSAPRRLMRNLALRTLNLLPPARRRLEMNLSGLARRDAAILPA